MIRLAQRYANATRYGSERAASSGAMTALAVGWLIALASLIAAASVFAEIGWSQTLRVAVLGASVLFALAMTRRVAASRRLQSITPGFALEQRYFGNLNAITDSEQRPLRPIGSTAREVAARTGVLLTDLASDPSVRIFHGVRPADPRLPLVPRSTRPAQTGGSSATASTSGSPRRPCGRRPASGPACCPETTG